MSSSDARAEAAGAFSAVAVVGLGVMGGSLARGLAALGHPPVAWSPDPDERRQAREAGAVERAPNSLAEAVAEADLVILATPLEAVCRLTGELAASCAPDAVLSDVASLKAPVLEEARRAGIASRWVGCHPMAGSEASGFGASRDDLYAGARIWLVADPEAHAAAERVSGLWRTLGARPARIEADEHDRLMALVSHLPQLASNALAAVLSAARISPEMLGPGGLEATRLAGSNPSIWRDILRYASPQLPESLRALAREAETLARLIEAGDVAAIEERMRRTRSWRSAT